MITTIKKIAYSLIVGLALLCSFDLNGQQKDLDTLRLRFDFYRNQTLQEKLFVHLERDFYLTGEIMWFRIYSLDATLHRPSDVSKVAYMEILDVSGKPVAQSKVKLSGGKGTGSYFIPAVLASGNYSIRFYTQWMRNFPVEYFFHKAITIVNPFVRPETTLPTAQPRPMVKFYPEGGNFVAGVKSRIGFQITGIDDDVRAAILRNEDDTVAIVQSPKFGLGSFELTAEAGVQYRFVVRTANGSVFTQALPEPQREGYALQVSDGGKSYVRVRVHHRSESSSDVPVYLFVHARQSVIKSEMKITSDDVAEFVIEKDKLPDGVSHFTLFNESLQPVCERLYFVRPRKELQLSISSSQSNVAPRREVILNVDAKLKESNAPSADLSLSVFKLDSALTGADKSGILHYLYLTSDLAGVVESPEFYFSDDLSAASAADNLMLTHGWRRFKWDDVLNKKPTISFVPEVRNHLVTGTVTRENGTPVLGALTYLSSPGRIVNVYGARSDKNGIVRFEVRDFWETRRLIMQVDAHPDSAYRVTVNEAFETESASIPVPPLKLDPSMEEALTRRSTSMQVQDIYYRDRAIQVRSVKVDSTAFYGYPDETYFLDDYTRFPVMEEVMREYVPGVLVRKRKDGFHFILLDRVNKGVLSGDPLVLLDGVPVLDVDRIMEFDPRRVKKLEVVTRKFYSGPMSLPGIVSYSTYGGDLAGFELDPGSVSINYEGLQLHREFYAPEYDSQKARASRLPDQRHTLHWQPQLSVVNGKATTKFFTSDVPGTYIVVVHGLTPDGAAGSATFTFEVKKANL